MAFQRQVKRGIEQRMTWADKGGQRFALRRNQRLLKGDPLVSRQHRLSCSDQAIPVTHRCWNMGHLIAAWFALASYAAKLAECLQEERLDKVWL